MHIGYSSYGNVESKVQLNSTFTYDITMQSRST